MGTPARQINRQQKSEPVPVPSPVGGWNTRDSVDAMEATDAVAMDNWFPGLGSCSLRSGSSTYATGLGGVVRTVTEFNAKGLRKCIAGANSRLWDVSSPGAATSLASGFTNDVWLTAQFDDASGGPRMGLVNGADAPQQYDGTTVSAMTISGTGLTPSLLNGIAIYKNRSYFWDDRTQDFWVSATNALGGTLTKFPLGRVTNGGGNLLGMGTWSRDAGNGMLDVAVFILNSGDVLVYAGDDPTSPSAWALVGRYTVGAPVSKRAIKKVGAELLVVTKAGYVPLTSILPKGRLNEERASISDKIRGAAGTAVNSYATNFGWDIVHYPAKNWLLVNVPVSASRFDQHVMNTDSGAWCRFLGMPAVSWSLYKDLLYFGTPNGTILQADSGRSDVGIPINADAQCAWNYLDSRRNIKRAAAMRMLLNTSGGPLSYSTGVGFDFRSPIALSVTQNAVTRAISTPWDTSAWDVSQWPTEQAVSNFWTSAKGSGFALSARLAITTSTESVDWFSLNYLIEGGGVL